jgi:DNA-binding Xre family transcriptional regulator
MNVPVCGVTSVVKIISMVTSNPLPYSLTNVSVLHTYYQAEEIPDQTFARICTITYYQAEEIPDQTIAKICTITYYQAEEIPDQTITRICTIMYY